MMSKNHLIYVIFGIFLSACCSAGLILAYLDVNTSLGILPPPYDVTYSPSHVTGMYTSGPVYVEIIGTGIKPNTTGIYHNGTYTFEFRRGTGSFATGAGYSSGNTRTYMQTTQTIDRIDDILPSFAGVADGVTYDAAVTITFSDDHLGATATINGGPFVNGSSISTNGTYQLIVTDAAGNSTGATFIIYLSSTPPGGGGGGGGGGVSLGVRSMIAKQCETRDCYSYYYNNLCGPCTPSEEEKSFIPGDRPPYYYVNPTPPTIAYSPYPKERNDAYLRAYRLGITTVPNIKDADLEGTLYRKFAAKMASEFAIKAVGLTPDEDRECNFTDISKEIPELQYYMRLSCKLGIMGLDYYGDPDTVFNPNYVVTRDQLVTILSRILFRNEYNIQHGELTFYDKARNFFVHSLTNIGKALGLDIDIYTPLDRYTRHLEAVKRLGIMTDYRITLKEFRIYVILIMYRLDQMGLTKIQNLNEAVTDSLK